MPTTEFLAQFYIKVNNQAVREQVMDDLDYVEIDQSLVLPDMFTMRFGDNFSGTTFDYIDGTLLEVGKEVKISVEPAGQTAKTELFKGEITAIETEFPADGIAAMLIRGYDCSHKLHRGKNNNTFLNQKDSDIVSKIASDCGLQSDVDSTSHTHEHVIQNNQTHMEFIQERARRNGYFTYVQDNKLYFKKPGSVGANRTQPELKWGDNLREFHTRLTTAEQVNKGVVHAWDDGSKQAIKENVASPSAELKAEINLSKWGGDAAKAAFNVEAEEVVNNRPVATPDEAKAMAQSTIDERFSAFLQAEGTCEGNPEVRPGQKVKIQNVGSKFSGSYLITRSVHRYDRDGGYTTRFEISGHRANTLGQLLSGNHNGNNGPGMVVGKVTNLDDPDDLGRIKVQYPAILAKASSDGIESGWARLVSPMAGAERGILFIPEIDDEVMVGFENGDINYPYILGSVWSNVDKPPLPNSEATGDGKVNKRVIKSRSGHTIILDDSSGAEKISIIDKTEKNQIDIDSAGNAITINSEADITIEGKQNLTLKGKTVVIEATQGGNMDLKANNIKAEATAKATLKGNSGVDVEGSGPVNIKSTAATKVEGTQVSVSGSAMTEIKGGIVKIN